MASHDDRKLRAIEARVRRDDPRFAKALEAGRPCRPREYRYGRAWLVMLLALTCLVVGMAVGDGLLVAGSLVMAGVAGNLFESAIDSPSGRPWDDWEAWQDRESREE